MPVLLDERVITLEFADLEKRRPITRPDLPPRRADGLHQSGILAYIARKIGKLKVGEKLEEDMPTIFALGFAWEEWCVSLYPEIEWQPGERTMDGISVNCDGTSYQNIERGSYDSRCGKVDTWIDALQVEEFKFTFKGTRTGPEFLDEWLWVHQGREYCHQYGARRERWHVLHVRGDYKSFGPIYKTYTLGFSDQECLSTHKMLLAHMEAARIDGIEEKHNG